MLNFWQLLLDFGLESQSVGAYRNLQKDKVIYGKIACIFHQECLPTKTKDSHLTWLILKNLRNSKCYRLQSSQGSSDVPVRVILWLLLFLYCYQIKETYYVPNIVQGITDTKNRCDKIEVIEGFRLQSQQQTNYQWPKNVICAN